MQPAKPCATKFFGLVCLASSLLVGCAPSNPHFGVPGSVPSNDEEQLIEAAVRRALVDEKDIPGYDLLKEKGRVVLQNVRIDSEPLSSEPLTSNDSLTLAFVPQFRDVEIVSASPAEIERLATTEGDFLYLMVGKLVIDEHSARVDLSLSWAQSPESRRSMAYLSGGGYTLAYVRQTSTWVFERIVSSWES